MNYPETNSNFTDLPDGEIPIKYLCAWSRTASMSMQNGVVTDVAWWAESDTVLRHQFVLLRLRRQSVDHLAELYYDIKLERLGKHFPSFSPLASDTATIRRVSASQAWESKYIHNHTLFFALISHLSFVWPKEDAASPLYFHRAFSDVLDEHRRGPPLRLRDLTYYLELLSSQSPNYSIASSNCFWYSRLLFHIISLRHYSFPILATCFPLEEYLIPVSEGLTLDTRRKMVHEKTWLLHDPSSTGLVFRFLHYEERRNGLLMYSRLIGIIATIFISGTIGGIAYGGLRLSQWILGTREARFLLFNTLFWSSILCLLLGALGVSAVRNAVTALTQWQIRSKTEALMLSMDTPDYIPPILPLGSRYEDIPEIPFRRRQEKIWFISFKKHSSPYEPMRVKIQQLVKRMNPENFDLKVAMQEGVCSRLIYLCGTAKMPAFRTKYLRLLNNMADSTEGRVAVSKASQSPPTMPLEATMMIIDNSEYMRNGDYQPTRFDAQSDAVTTVVQTKIDTNPENTVGIMTMAGKGPEVLVTHTKEIGHILSALHATTSKIGGEVDIPTALAVAQLALKHRSNKNLRQRIIVFVASPLTGAGADDKGMIRLAKKLKKNNVAVDIVCYGDGIEQEEFTAEDGSKKTVLKAFIENTNSGDNSHMIIVPPSTSVLLSDALISSPILAADRMASIPDDLVPGGAGDGAGGSGGANNNNSQFEFGVDPSLDPELAMALRLSMQEAAARDAAEAATSSSSTTAPADPTDSEEDALLKQALALSQQDGDVDMDAPPPPTTATASTTTGAGDAMDEDDDDEEAAIARAIAMSMEQPEDNTKSK
ncbi:Multiubiquitin chain binding protein MBP1 [Mycena indigotica]|uniref:Multiubiquitin chain binding protein MBP1 n=1 Tax=Mycena indigotica TaxID=2126181 RepID=A0A8H6SJX6_9AGAR|nr:Multiubiquitin chain binding protein MBP1 [Mycena indigotica]KAF7301070.1 Multiubiquitin chain binding protein MBP1 [Mycena indigotica]